MFNSKINGSFEEEFESLTQYKNSIIKDLESKRKHSKIMWSILSALSFGISIATLIVASITLNMLMNDYNSGIKDVHGNSIQFSALAPTIAAVAFIIVIFILNTIIAFYQAIMKADMYKEAAQTIQYETMRWKQCIDEYEVKKGRDELFRKNIKHIEKTIAKSRKKLVFKQVIINAVTGGKNE